MNWDNAMDKIEWYHIDNYQPQQEEAFYMVSDGNYVGIGVLNYVDEWQGRNVWMSLHFDEDDMDLMNNAPDYNSFVFWAQMFVPRFGTHKLDPQEAQMLNAEEDLRQRMRIIEEFGPDMLKDSDDDGAG